MNPWEKLDLEIYESHMELATVSQLQLLNKIMKSQFYTYKIDSVGIWGVAGGNGLEHISCNSFNLVQGIDINQKYLEIAKKRYLKLDCLSLKKLDLNDVTISLDKVDLIIANLLIEYIGLDTFITQLSRNSPKYVSCVIQEDNASDFVSKSPYNDSLKAISELALLVDGKDLISRMGGIGFKIVFKEKYVLFDEKSFIRLDFRRVMI